MASTDYISTTDITATVCQDFNLSGYVTRANNHFEYFARSLGVGLSGIADPIHSQAKEYLIAWTEREVYKDKMGANNVDFDSDKYVVLFDIQNKEVPRLRRDLTKEMIQTASAAGNETASTVILYRG